MTILGLDLEEWRKLLKIVVSTLLMTVVLVFVGLLIHEGAHIFVALALGCEVTSLQFIIFSSWGFAGGEVWIRAGPYLVPIAFAGGFAEGLYFLVLRKSVKSRGLWIVTLSCWVYALAEVWWVSPPKGNLIATILLDAMTNLMLVILYVGLVWPRLDELMDSLDYQKTSVDLSVWVPSDRRRE